MEVTEIYQSTSTDFGEISTMVEGENSEEATTKAFILNVFAHPPPNLDSDLRFSTIDYVVFAIMLAMSGKAQFVAQRTFTFTALIRSPHRNLFWLHFKEEAKQHEGIFARRQIDEFLSYRGLANRITHFRHNVNVDSS